MLNNIIAPKQQRVDFPNLISKRAPNCLTVINAADSSYHFIRINMVFSSNYREYYDVSVQGRCISYTVYCQHESPTAV